jgi:hypothetical protein
VSGNWSHAEVAATVADYLSMLDHELRGEAYNKAEHNRRLQQFLNGRTRVAVDRKHQNISAVMIELGLPYIDGFKPLRNYQAILFDEVVAQLTHDRSVEQATESLVDAPVIAHATVPEFLVIEDPPQRERPKSTYERPAGASTPINRINYLEREARNASLGLAGEQFVLEVEHRRLWMAGARHLAERIEHVATTKGDGLGYDILSFDADGRERFIEVKTTAFGKMTPFFASAKEVATSEMLSGFQLYRVFKFREAPRIFALVGSIRQAFVLEPIQFRASLP